MSGASRKVKNPLLSAAGDGFPFDNYAESALLVPITPATPAVLGDDAQLDNFVGQDPNNSNQTTTTEVNANVEVSAPSHVEEKTNPVGQPVKQGYFTSILSSLPNLSLSSITGDSSASQPSQGHENPGGTYNVKPNVPSHDRRGSLRETSSPLAPNPQDPRGTNLGSGEANLGSTGILSNPAQAIPPPSVPLSTDGPVSYRLGNQRRLKYAPPPDLTSNASKYPVPGVQTLFTPQNVSTPPTILNPVQSVAPVSTYSPVEAPIPSNSPSVQQSSSEQLSQSNSLQGSFRSSPVAGGIPYSSIQTPQSRTPQSQSPYYESVPLAGRAGISVSSSRPIPSRIPEPATPQNTPANVSFPGFELYTAQRDFLSTPSSDKESNVLKDLGRIVSQAGGSKDSSTGPLTDVKKEILISGSSDAAFTPISAVKVTEKLEHLLAERKEDLSNLTEGSKIEERRTGDQILETSKQKVEDVEEKSLQKQDSLTDVFLGQEASESIEPPVVPRQAHQTTEKIVPEGHAITSNVQQFQQYYQQPPVVSSVSFFEKHDQKSNLNYPPPTEIFSNPSNSFKHSPSSFFEAPDSTESFPPFQYKETGAPPAEPPPHKDTSFNLTPQTQNIQHSQDTSFNLAPQIQQIRQSQDTSFNLSPQTQNIQHSQDTSFNLTPQIHQTRQSQDTTFNLSPQIQKIQQSQDTSFNLSPQTQQIQQSQDTTFNLSPQIQKIQQSQDTSFNLSPQTQQIQQSQDTSFNLSPQTQQIQQSQDTSAFAVPQSLWTKDQTSHVDPSGAGCSAPLQPPPPPLFYNPTQLQADSSFQQPPLAQKYVPPVQSVSSSSQSYFENPIGAYQPYDINSGATNTAFLSTSPQMATVVPEPTGSATLNLAPMSVNPVLGRSPTDTVPPSLQNLAAGPGDKRMQYRTVYHHWFYRKEVEHKVLWLPFSMQDSLQLEEVHNSSEITPETIVATDGGRYDVDILRRRRTPVYWTGTSTEVRRCSWFFKGPTESRYVPYDESTAAKLEEEYKQACLSNNWNRRIDLNNGEYIIFHSATVQVHYSQPSSPELAASWGNSAGSEDSTYLQGAASRPRVIKRGLDEFHIEDGEPEKVDHLLFLVHGIGSVCDLKFRTVEEVVDEFRSISLQLVQSHYRTASEQRIVNRIEVLPISWHTTLHSDDTGIDKKLRAITLESIPKLRHFTNDTLLDILFYTSPVYCQTIIQTVGNELNRLYSLFRERNPDFDGGIYLGGHSLGSLILFDLLCHQKPLPEEQVEEQNEEDKKKEEENTGLVPPLPAPVLKRRLSKKISYVMGAAGTGQPYIHYPQLNFNPRAFFALGSPIGMFVTVRGIDTLGEDFALPTCPAFFNVFHPFDPVAYRVESLINPEAHKYRPMLIPHHKGRKRMHLELKETMARVGADLKQKLLDSVRNTWNSVYQLAVFHKPDNHALEREIDKVVEEQLQKTPTVPDQQNTDDAGADFKVGRLNGGRRVDYVLQEAPFEYINEYIFALTSHVCYWESEDTMLMILKEIYGSSGIQTDAQLPQQTLSIERVPPSPTSLLSPSTSTKNDVGSPTSVGMDPTAPISEKPVGPPPKSGFVRKS